MPLYLSNAFLTLSTYVQAMNEIITLVSSESFLLTVETICHLHRILMNTSRVLFVGAQNKWRLSYVNAGITRATTCANVTVAGYSGMDLQFCPYDQVDEELRVFCERFNVCAISLKSQIVIPNLWTETHRARRRRSFCCRRMGHPCLHNHSSIRCKGPTVISIDIHWPRFPFCRMEMVDYPESWLQSHCWNMDYHLCVFDIRINWHTTYLSIE